MDSHGEGQIYDEMRWKRLAAAALMMSLVAILFLVLAFLGHLREARPRAGELLATGVASAADAARQACSDAVWSDAQKAHLRAP